MSLLTWIPRKLKTLSFHKSIHLLLTRPFFNAYIILHILHILQVDITILSIFLYVLLFYVLLLFKRMFRYLTFLKNTTVHDMTNIYQLFDKGMVGYALICPTLKIRYQPFIYSVVRISVSFQTSFVVYLVGPFDAGPFVPPAPLTPALLTPVPNCKEYKNAYFSVFSRDICQRMS